MDCSINIKKWNKYIESSSRYRIGDEGILFNWYRWKKTVILHALLEVWGTLAPAAIIVTTVICIKEAKRKKEQEENPNPSDEEPCESDKLVHDSEDEKEENNKKAENIAEHEKVVNTENLLGPDNDENQEN